MLRYAEKHANQCLEPGEAKVPELVSAAQQAKDGMYMLVSNKLGHGMTAFLRLYDASL